MHDTVTMGFEFDHKSPIKEVEWLKYAGEKLITLTANDKYVMHSLPDNK